MKFKKFNGNKPPPLGSSIPKMKKVKMPRTDPVVPIDEPQEVAVALTLETPEIRAGKARRYSSKPWKDRALRNHVNILHGEEWWICYLCQATLSRREVTLDHYIPRSAGGGINRQNIKPCCWECNQRKADTVPGKAV